MSRHSAFSWSLFILLAASSYAAGTANSHSQTHAWDSTAAAKYLDTRQAWWMQWPTAQRDHETACVSCHTAVPYAMARPSLRNSLGEHSPSAPEQEMLKHITRRVDLWNDVQPFYNDEEEGPRKTVESRGTEAVLNALVLARYDVPQGKMTTATRLAFDHMWATQITKGVDIGSWEWLNFHNAPWESNESHYYGTTLAAIAVGLTPADYRKSPEIQSGLKQMNEYLVRNYEAQPLVNRIVLLWASSKLPGLLSHQRQSALLEDIRAHQKADGGWSLSNMGPWKRNDDTALDARSDGYATGLVVYALKQAGVSQHKPEMQKGITWLEANQDEKQGLWPAYSLNKQRDPQSDIGRFMSDAATSYSVMALEAVHR